MAEVARERIVPAQLERLVYERVRDDILAGALEPGSQLVESRIAEELGVSKTPVREALIRLQRDGLVAIEPYRGARVVEPSPDDIREILELRLLLERQIARDLARSRPAEVIRALDASIDRGLAAAATGSRQGVLDSLTEFSDIQTAACGNSRMAKLLDDLRSVLLLIGATSLRAPGRAERSLGEHEEILEAIKAGDAEAAALATERHVASIERDSLEPTQGSLPR
jgi:DNA-binding GntR family transcriptional regulator